MLINVKVITRASKNEIEKISDCIYKIKVTAVPERGKANEAAISLLADYFKVPKSLITIKAGTNISNKLIEINKN